MKKETLKQDFLNRKNWLKFTASAIYPLDIKQKSDFVICFPNYWKIKNKIKNLTCSLKLYTQDGNQIRTELFNIKLHNEIFFSKIFKLKKFLGMLEIDFHSTENLKFEFPGITGFYISSAGHISCVHSAGRILYPNQKSAYNKTSEETNFSLKYVKKKITPFFSLFNSFIEKKNNKIIITMKDSNNKILGKKILKNDIKFPYSNKIFYLEKYFSGKILNKSSFCVVNTNACDVFPRMICGNYHKKIHHYEVTHSYPIIRNKNDIINVKNNRTKNLDHHSYLHFVKSKETDLILKIFPTNLKANLKAKLFLYDPISKDLKFSKFINFNSGTKIFTYQVDKNCNFGIISIKQNGIPSRINATYIYKNNNKNNLSTDIALAFKTIEYPVKTNHWGSFMLSKDIKSQLLMRKVTHLNEKKISDGFLNIYSDDKLIYKKKLKITNNSYQILDLNKMLDIKNSKLKTFSWIATFKKKPGGVDFFSNIFSKEFICGDHGF